MLTWRRSPHDRNCPALYAIAMATCDSARQAHGALNRLQRLARPCRWRRYCAPATARLHAPCPAVLLRSEEHTSELQSLMRISYAVFCLKKKNTQTTTNWKTTQ